MALHGTESAPRGEGTNNPVCNGRVAMQRYIVLVLLFSWCVARQRINAQTVPDLNGGSGSSNNSSSVGTPDQAGTNDSMDWLFPVDNLNRSLPRWFRFGGEYRGRIEGPMGIGFTGTNDFYLLDRLRVNLAVQPKEWLLFYGEVQDARIFFNHHNPNANPYQDKWTLWQAYSQVGSSEAGWVDVLAGRQILRFGDERVIGPSDWLNVGRTFNVARVDLHHPGYRVSVFASSVVPGDNTDLHNALPGNNLYGVYGSFQNGLAVAPSMKSPLVSTGRASYPPLSITTLNLTDRRDRSAHLPLPRGRAMPASAKRCVRSPARLVFFLRAITPLERKIRTATTGTPLMSSILRIMISWALLMRLVAATSCSSEPVSKKSPRTSGNSNSNLKATGWPLQMTTSTPAVEQLRFPLIPARAATSATSSIWLPNTM